MLFPNGYATQVVTLDKLRAIHEPKMHPEFARRLFAWIESQQGHIGIGGGWRSTQPDKPGFAPDGKSFHQSQRFASGITAYAAVDLVAASPGRVHRAPTWAESTTAPHFGLHTFVSGEPWHIQCIEMRGWQTWVNAGRPDPPSPLPPPDPPVSRPTMHPIRYRASDVELKANEPMLMNIGATPRSARGAQIRITAVAPQAAGYVDAWGPDIVWPGTATVNYAPNDIVGGVTFVGLDVAGQYWMMASTDCRVIVDVSGWS